MNHLRIASPGCLAGCFALFFLSAGCLPAQTALEYPKTQTVDHVDVYHGVKVADPYRWLEDDVRESKDVAAWVKAQNEVTFEYLEKIPERKPIEKRLTKLWNYEKYGSPFKRGGAYYYFKNDGLQNQDVLYRLESLDAEPEVLIDPNTWSKDGTVALAGAAFSDDGKHLAYGIQDAGSDWRTWRVMTIAGGKVLDDELKWVKFSGVSWTRDSKGFFLRPLQRARGRHRLSESEPQPETLLPPSGHASVRGCAGLRTAGPPRLGVFDRCLRRWTLAGDHGLERHR